MTRKLSELRAGIMHVKSALFVLNESRKAAPLSFDPKIQLISGSSNKVVLLEPSADKPPKPAHKRRKNIHKDYTFAEPLRYLNDTEHFIKASTSVLIALVERNSIFAALEDRLKESKKKLPAYYAEDRDVHAQEREDLYEIISDEDDILKERFSQGTLSQILTKTGKDMGYLDDLTYDAYFVNYELFEERMTNAFKTDTQETLKKKLKMNSAELAHCFTVMGETYRQRADNLLVNLKKVDALPRMLIPDDMRKDLVKDRADMMSKIDFNCAGARTSLCWAEAELELSRGHYPEGSLRRYINSFRKDMKSESAPPPSTPS